MSSKKYPEHKPDPTVPSKVAETAVSTYTVSPAAKRKPVAKGRRIAGLEAPDEVWEFAQKHRLVPHLETAVRLAKESFHDLRTLYLTFAPDPELPSLDGIVIYAKADGTLDDLVQQDRAFALRFTQAIPHEFRSKISLFLGKA
jgi:hypothetical protein